MHNCVPPNEPHVVRMTKILELESLKNYGLRPLEKVTSLSAWEKNKQTNKKNLMAGGMTLLYSTVHAVDEEKYVFLERVTSTSQTPPCFAAVTRFKNKNRCRN